MERSGSRRSRRDRSRLPYQDRAEALEAAGLSEQAVAPEPGR
jgi:hypothetical protein